MPLYVDDSQAPLILMRFDGVFSDVDLSQFYEKAVQIHQRAAREKRKFAWVVDTSSSGMSTPQQRMALASFTKRNYDLIKANQLGAAVVTKSAIQRGAVTAFSWLIQLPYPLHAVATLDEGIRWAQDLIKSSQKRTSAA